MASVRELRPGYWQVREYAGRGPDGRKRYASKSLRGTRRDAVRAGHELALEVANGDHTTQAGTVADLVDRAIEHGVAVGRIERTTEQTYRQLLDTYVRPAIGAMPARKVKAPDLDRLYAELLDHGGRPTKAHPAGRPLSPATVRKVHVLLSGAWNQGLRWGIVGSDPTARTTPPRVPKHEVRPPSTADLVRVLEHVEAGNPQLGVLLRLGAATGARRGELCALQWGDVDLDAGVLTVRRAVGRVGRTWVVKTPKGRQSRKLALGPGTVALLRRWRRTAVEEALALGVKLTPASWVFGAFGTGFGEHFTPLAATRAWEYHARRCGVAARLHDIRHLHATLLLDAGHTATAVAARLGHRDTTTTLNIYGAALAEADVRAGADIERLLG